MGEIIGLRQSKDYLLGRAKKQRDALNYDSAMALLTLARDQYGPDEEIEMALAETYDEMDCEAETARSFLRVARMNGKRRAQALFNLTLGCMQNSDYERAKSYFQQFAASDREGIDEETAAVLAEQLKRESEPSLAITAKGRARMLEKRAVQRLQEGKAFAARRTLQRALAMRPTAQGYTLLACCHLVLSDYAEAVRCAELAHKIAPKRVQTLCVLADSLEALGEEKRAKRAAKTAAICCQDNDDRIAAAVETAKLGLDELTLRLTEAVLSQEPVQIQAIRLSACALYNLGRRREAEQRFGRLCGLLPEDTVCEAYYRMLRENSMPEGRMALGMDVPREETIDRMVRLMTMLYAPAPENPEPEEERSFLRTASWALRSAIADGNGATVALMLLGARGTEGSKEVLLDAMTDPQLPDSVKLSALQVVSSVYGDQAWLADVGGRYVRLAAGVTTEHSEYGQEAQRVPQRVSDKLTPRYPQAAKELLSLWVRYIDENGLPPRRLENAYAAALEYAWQLTNGRPVELRTIAKSYDVSKRLAGVLARRIAGCGKTKE